MENNFISSLHGIQRVRSLLELYIGNNHISTSQDIYYLKARKRERRIVGFRFSHHFYCVVCAHMLLLSFQGLSNLIILDLYGNPLLEKLENYRIYVVFHLPSLKALDGIAVVCTASDNQSNFSDDVIIYCVLYLLLFSLGSNRV